MRHEIKFGKQSRGPFVEPHRRASCACGWVGEWTDSDGAKQQGRRHIALAGMGRVSK